MTEKTETKTEAQVKAPKKENPLKPLLTLEPIFIGKLSKKLKPYARVLYYVLTIILAVMLIKALADLFTVGFSAFVVEVALIAIYFVIVRMFAEYLAND